MIGVGLLLSLVAAPAVDVVVLSKYRPTEARFSGTRCTVAGARADRVGVQDGGLQVCLGAKCKASVGPVNLLCTKPAAVIIDGVEPRRYGRSFRLAVREGRLRIVASIPEAHYVEGVVASELTQAPKEALRAQAVLVRTYVRHAQANPRHDDAPVCDLTHCQAFRNARPLDLGEGRRLVRADGTTPPIFFHSTCGGTTWDAWKVWPGSDPKHELVGISDVNPRSGEAWCAGGRHFRWVTEVSEGKMAKAIGALIGRKLDSSSVRLEAEDAHGLQWRVGDRRGMKPVSGRSLHRHLGRALGWSVVKSSRFEAIRAGKTFRLRGLGLGHGVGMCQVGAVARARAGHDARAILKAYFPKLRLAR